MALKNNKVRLQILLLITDYNIKKLLNKKNYNYCFQPNMLVISTNKKLNKIEISNYDLNIISKALMLDAYLNQYKRINDNWLLNIYLKNLTYYYLNINLSWRFVNIIKTVNRDFLNKLWYKFYKKKFFGILYGKKKKTLTWFLQLYKLKDPQGVIFLIQRILFKANLKRHKRYFYLVGAFFKALFINKEKKNSLKGFTLFFKGKLGKKGSVRKTKFFVKYGLGSLTNKSLRINYKTYVIITITGVVGCNICLFYK